MNKTESKNLLSVIEERLKIVRPCLRQEYKDMIGDSFKGMDEAEFRGRIFDYDRAPFIEKKGMDQAKTIIFSVPIQDFPDQEIYLLTVLHRLELFFYDLVRPVEEVKEEDTERRTLMFKTGVRKMMRAVAGLLPEKTEKVWAFRRLVLDTLESDLWKLELGLTETTPRGKAPALSEMADTLHALAPAELAAMETPEELSSRFASTCGAAAKNLAAQLAEKQQK